MPAIFSDGAVLQRDQEVAVWGWADAGKAVKVSFGSQKKQITASADGKWMVKLDAMPASTEARALKVLEAGGKEVVVNNILVGEVWLASGQSNMEWDVNASQAEDKASATGKPLPQIRMIKVPKQVMHERQDDFVGAWAEATPEQVLQFSAVGYFFARQLHEQLNVPVGIINSSWGGTFIEPWLAEEGFTKVPELADMAKSRASQLPGSPAYEAAKKAVADAATEPEKKQAMNAMLPLQRQTGMYQAMIHPVRHYGIKGFIWYQGESNMGDGMLYYHKMKVLIDGWRQQFGMPNAPFLYVQLAPFTYKDTALPEIWTAQQKALEIPNTGMAVINDIGNPKNIHPGNKSEVGRRLSLWALDRTYGVKQKVVSGPLYSKSKVDGDKIHVLFEYSGSGLASRDGKDLTYFEIAGVDGVFHPATAVINPKGDSITLTSAEVPAPKQVRFAWNQIAEPNLMNKEGLPASAFHSHWPQ